MRLSHVKCHRGTVVEEEQTALDALRDGCGLSCQEMGGCIKKAAGRDAFHTGGNRGYPIYKHFNIPNIDCTCSLQSKATKTGLLEDYPRAGWY